MVFILHHPDRIHLADERWRHAGRLPRIPGEGAEARRARRRDLRPNLHGLFNTADVAEICRRRKCMVEFVHENLGARVHRNDQEVIVNAYAPGWWSGIEILSACSKVCQTRVFEVDFDRMPASPCGLDEFKIAHVVAAAGVRPYLAKRGRYGADREGFDVPGLDRQEALDAGDQPTPFARKGQPTWTFYQILHSWVEVDRSEIRRGLRALEDLGLMEIELGPRRQMSTATCMWSLLAYLPTEDDFALGQIAAGYV